MTATPKRIDLDERTTLPDSWRGGYISIGNFDGVHLGHVDLLRRLKDAAGSRVPTITVTFDPHPIAVLRAGHEPAPLTLTDRKAELLLESGADGVAVFRTGTWLLGMTAREFFDRVVRGLFGARGLVEGPTFGFGRDRQGTVERLSGWSAEAGIDFRVAPAVEAGGEVISSSRIRALLLAGRAEEATTLLGRPHRLNGRVVRGAGRGAGIGFPTANLGDVGELVPDDGVYAAWARVEGVAGAVASALHIGPNATFGERARTIEANLLDFEGDLYGRRVELDLVQRVRGTRRFDDLASLVGQIGRDVEAVRERLGVRVND